VRAFDVLVVGAGSAGSAAAAFFAASGRRVALVDKRPRGETGARWVNAIPAWCFDRAGVARPSGEETPFAGDTHRVHLIGPGRRSGVAIADVPMLHVDMRAFVARLVDDAIRAGAELATGHVEHVERVGGRVRAVSFANGSERFTLRARLIVDASGAGGAIRKRVPLLSARCPDAGPADRCAAAQFQHDVADPAGLRAFLARHGAVPGDAIAFSGIAGGYSTLSLFTHPELSEVGVLTGSMPGLGVPSGLALYERFVASARWLGSKRYGGAGSIPLRRPYATLGAEGVALIGDAASQVYASHGSGVGMGLLAARALADAARVEQDPGSEAVLARYASAFHRAHGGLLVASDAFRRYLQGVASHELDALLAAGLVDADMSRAALSQVPTRPDARFVLRAPLRAARAFTAARRFLPLAARTVLLDALGAFGGTFDRLIEPLLGDAARAAGEGEWTLPLD